MVNLKYWREHDVEPGLLEYAKRHREEVYLHDQDVLNYYFKKKWFLLPPKWNHVAGTLKASRAPQYKSFDMIAYAKEPMVYHYASVGMKPWYAVPTPEKSLYLKYLKISGYKESSFDNKPLGKSLQLIIETMKYDIKKVIQKALLSNHVTEQLGGGKL